MGRDTGPKWKLARREGFDLFGRGMAGTGKSPLARRNYPPGQHAGRNSRQSPYGLRLREKQRLKRIYGIRERQCRSYYIKAAAQKGDTGANLLCLLERRLDAVLATAGFSKTIAQARQWIVHRHFLVNGKRVDVPSFSVSEGDVITARAQPNTQRLVDENLQLNAGLVIPDWLEINVPDRSVRVVGMPGREDIPFPVAENLIIEFYSM